MAGAVDQFSERVSQQLRTRITAAEPEVSEFDLSSILAILLPLLLDALTGLLDGCLSSSRGHNAVAERLKTGGFFRAYMIRRTLRQPAVACPPDKVAICCDAVTAVLDDMSQADATSLVREVRDGLHHWDFA